MANPEHLAILDQGVDAWNNWRRKNPDERPDFGRANLYWKDLAEANLNEANLRWAALQKGNLVNANLQGADLKGANLSGSKLNWADLSWAVLDWATLADADMSNANLSGANLIKADLARANLYSTDLSNAEIGFTSFSSLDLSKIKGLHTVTHRGPSSIGIDTIYLSGGKIPSEFLRGCGVPEDFIAFQHSLVNNPIEYYSCFISYSSKDEDFAKRLHADLQAANVRCWFAPHDMAIGDKIRERIDESIRIYDKLLLILSCDSIFSNWVEKEVETAFEQEQPNRKNRTVLFPIRLDDEVMDTNKAWAADIRRTRHIGDFTRWKDHDAYKAAFDRLLRDLKASAKAKD
ncbi:MAG: toll/interleukin-1 receptor domain-containing protein [Desulfarculus sp.]|nr:toll/interleukin-1 receptor domain-containing protein [Desulfarculus sp.]